MSIRELNVELMKTQTFGVEIECSGISPRAMAIVCARSLGVDENEVVPERYNHDGTTLSGYAFRDRLGKKWRVVHDGSLYSSTTDSGLWDGGCGELVTPVLTYDRIPELQQIARDLRANGAVSNARYGCGVHVHVGADVGKENGHNARTLRNLSNLVAKYERLMRKSINFTPSRDTYCGLTNERWLTNLNTARPRTIDQIKGLWYVSHGRRDLTSAIGNHYDNSRYHTLNLHSVFLKLLANEPEKATCEFRCFEFHKQIHAGELKAYIQFCLAVNQYSKLVRSVSVAPLPTENDKKTMKDFLSNLGLNGDEFKTCRKMWTRRLTGDTAYRHGRPVADDLDDTHLQVD